MDKDKSPKNKYVSVETFPKTEEDAIDLMDLISKLLRAWKAIVIITFLSTAIALSYAIQSPKVFKSDTLLAPVQVKNKGAYSALGQFGGLARMVGAEIPSDSNVEHVIATLESRKFLARFIKDEKLMKELFEENWDVGNQAWSIDPPPSEQSAIRALKSKLSVDLERRSGLITLSVDWSNTQMATKVANQIVKQLNGQLRDQAIADSKKRIGYLEQELAKTTLQDMRAVLYNLLESENQNAMLANVNEDFALEVIDPAVESTQHYKPNRKLIVVIGTVCGGIIGISSVLLFNLFRNLNMSKTTNQNIDA